MAAGRLQSASAKEAELKEVMSVIRGRLETATEILQKLQVYTPFFKRDIVDQIDSFLLGMGIEREERV